MYNCQEHELGDLFLTMQTLQNNRVTQANDNAVICKHTQARTEYLHFFDKKQNLFWAKNFKALLLSPYK